MMEEIRKASRRLWLIIAFIFILIFVAQKYCAISIDSLNQVDQLSGSDLQLPGSS